MTFARPRPAVLLAAIAAVGLLVLLLAAAPPAVTLRAIDPPAAPLALKTGQTCFPLDVLPSETQAVRLFAAPSPAQPPTRVELTVSGRAVATTSGPSRRGRNLEYRLPAATRGDRLGAALCVTAPSGGAVLGASDRPSIELLGAPRSNWLSALPLLARRAAFGRGTVIGVAALPLALLALLAAWITAVRVGARSVRSASAVTRRTAAQVGAVAALFGCAFALTTPPIEAPDEMVHLQYAELLVDTGHPPESNVVRDPGQVYSPQLNTMLGAVGLSRVAFAPDRRPPWTQAEDHALDAALKSLPSGGSGDGFTNASSQPPGYYVLLAIAQKITGGSILDRLLIDRLLSALLFGLGVMGAVIFAREAVPRAGGLVVAGGLVLAALPIVGFIGGSVNPDAALFATSAWTLAVLARILRRGVTVRLGATLGLLLGLGLLSKLTFIGLLPAVPVAAAVVLVRAARAGTLRTALTSIGAALAVMAIVALPYLGWATLSGRGIAFGPPGGVPPVIHTRELIAYTVELFFGRFGPLADRIPGSGPYDIWAVGLAGHLGWLDYSFSRTTVHRIADVWLLLGFGALWGVLRSARARRAIPWDAVVYAVAVGSIMLLIARTGLNSRLQGATGFEQARYLFPVAAIGAGGVALALRQLPRPALREWAGSLVIVLALLHGTAAFLLTVGRYFA